MISLQRPLLFCTLQYPKAYIAKQLNFVSELNGFNFIVLSETWLRHKIPTDSFCLQRYHSPVRKDSTDGTHGGVCLYVKENVHFTRRSDLDITYTECLWIEVFF